MVPIILAILTILSGNNGSRAYFEVIRSGKRAANVAVPQEMPFSFLCTLSAHETLPLLTSFVLEVVSVVWEPYCWSGNKRLQESSDDESLSIEISLFKKNKTFPYCGLKLLDFPVKTGCK